MNNDLGQLFIDAVNSNSKDERISIARKIYSQKSLVNPGEEKLLSLFETLNSQFGHLEYHSSEYIESKMNDGTVRTILHLFAKNAASKTWKDIQFVIDPAEPGKILNIAFIADVTEPVYLPNGSIEQPQTIEWLNKYVTKLHNDNSFYGSIIIAKGDDVIFEKYEGFSNPQTNSAFEKNTLFNMASGGKMFTAIAIAQLVNNGLLKYEDKIEKYFPDFEDKQKLDKVTVHHLLNHSSGIAEYWSKETTEQISKFTSPKEYLPVIYKAGFLFEPETEFGYSNSNYILLGLVIEQVTGQSFYDYVKQNILIPAGMESTDYYVYGTSGIPLAIPLDRSGDNWVEASHGTKGSSAGGSYTTLQDMLRFSKALKNNILLPSDALKIMVKDQTTGLKDATGYGYGFEIEKYGMKGLTYGHGGMANGVNFEYRYFPEMDITLVICCNQNNGAFDDLKKNTIKLISGDR